MTESFDHSPLSAVGRRPLGLLVLHGFTGSPHSMRPVAEFFAERGYAVELPLLPGHGTRWEDLVGVSYRAWLAEVDSAYWRLRASGHDVVVVGLSMGGTLAIRQAVRRRCAGVVLINPFVQNPTPLLRLSCLLPPLALTVGGVASDIATPGVTEGGYPRLPLAAAKELYLLGAETRPMLAALKVPVLYFRSVQDHVVSDGSHRFFQKHVTSPIEFIELQRSYHVATLDYDAPLIFNRTLEFVENLESCREGRA